MNKRTGFPARVFIEEDVRDDPFTLGILESLGRIPIEIILPGEDLSERFSSSPDPVAEGKRSLLLARQKGEFVKPCPCTPAYLGCRYFIINLDLGCPLDCSYCILQHYLSRPAITVHVNEGDMFDQLTSFLESNPRPLRIGTGELGDSLALDHLTGRSKRLIDFFRCHPLAQFELKTKTINIEHVLESKPAENIILAWSLNSQALARSQERGAPPVKARIEAARRIVAHGFRVAFHFDPIIHHTGWEEGYGGVIDEMLRRIPASRIAWISLGSLRFPAQLKPVIQERFPRSDIVYDEFIRGRDGKLRYFLPLRRALYRGIVERIRLRGGERVPLYFCMESKRLWREVLKKEPEGEGCVEAWLSSPSGFKQV